MRLCAASAATVRPPDNAICETLDVSRAVCSNEPTTVDDELSAGCG